MKTSIPASIIFLLLLSLSTAFAWHPRLQEEAYLDGRGPAPVISDNFGYLIGGGEDLIDLARRAGVGYRNLVTANPGIDPWQPEPGREIIIPHGVIMPVEAGPGITINLAELRLYLVWQENGQRQVRFYPIGIGREGRDTPPGQYLVANRAQHPSWSPPPSIRAERPDLPPIVPPGPNNPLGEYWIGLNDQRIGIHGTNKPYGVGRRVSSGCIRLYPEDIADLYSRVRVGMPVRIIEQPIKVGQRNGEVFLEVHPGVPAHNQAWLQEVLWQKAKIAPGARLDLPTVQRALKEQRGIPVPVSLPAGLTRVAK